MSIEEELSYIQKSISTEAAQLRLQQILTDKILTGELQSIQAHELLQNISAQLTKSLLESKLYHMINTAKIQTELEGNFSISKSILNLNGNFVWHDKATEKFFQISENKLLGSSFFSLINANSLRYLYSKYTQEIFKKHKRVIISYILIDGNELTSRCTLVNYSPSQGIYKKGVFIETRYSRHKVMKWNSSLSVSPIMDYSDNNLLFTPLQITPSLFTQHHDVCVMDLENLRITPFLKADSPYKRRKIEECIISDF
ncbi:hypothetical protein SteCoe_18679 [Stentor coeruleus]|uniref:PAS domain-containing protein n=1 Tax=Stentor coeruleus TaxID=5963 RepID=A0A1R2BW21_9CILI|nr:hypothetical protein SteCoe_18679 [Stentor coeruleus]